ncbi:ankyrin repeat-containing domain protein [Xylogone sp. PMI_703]|nr:ankyrin repeat-containing domain protein [Xylogone sp. PMI_703]
MAETPPASCSSDSSDDFALYGRDDPVVRVVDDVERVRELLAGGAPIRPGAMFAAIDVRAVDTLNQLLDAGVDTNSRLDGADTAGAYVTQDWASSDLAPEFSIESSDERDWYAIYHAASLASFRPQDKAVQYRMMMSLLDHKADIYAIFRQPLDLSRLTRCIYPGEDPPRVCNKEDEFEEESNGGDEDTALPRQYGQRSVLHAILEDGHLVQPILEHPDISLNLDHRDPQGRTPFLSACHSSLGADAGIDGCLTDVSWDVDRGGYIRDPFQEATNKSLLHNLLERGTDGLAVDASGRNALHHLLLAHDHLTKQSRPPIINQSLKFISSRFPSLVNQPDHYGTYPLHCALQRIRRYPICDRYVDFADPEGAVDILLAAGADPSVRDGRGNTVLHYVAAEGLAEVWRADGIRRLFRKFISLGVDINLRNAVGRTALELVLDDDGTRGIEREKAYGHLARPPYNEKLRTTEEIDGEVFGMFDEAGVRWSERDGEGCTACHIVAASKSPRSGWRFSFLVEKGVDSSIKDNRGRSALDVAIEYGNRAVR